MYNPERFGTSYGGYWCYPELISSTKFSYILDLGVGEDTSFSEEIRKQVTENVTPVFVDPTLKSLQYCVIRYGTGFPFHRKAVAVLDKKTRIWINKRGEASDSLHETHSAVGNEWYETEGITIPKLMSLYSPVSLIKMDIEGSEYQVVHDVPVVPQVIIELHSFCIRSIANDEDLGLIRTMCEKGYRLHHMEKSTLLFVHKEYEEWLHS